MRYNGLMLMFVFGAGASFDSDPYRLPNPDDTFLEDEHRPPLAPGLFNPQAWRAKEVVAAYPRARALIMQLRQATAQGLDIEEVLEQRARNEAYPKTAVQLLALRAYLAELMTIVPSQWVEECQGLTNYVLALEKVDRWNVAVHGDNRAATGCVTFNYDALLEDAVHSVFGHRINDMDKYTNSTEIRIYKPHGSATWRVPAKWDLDHGNWVPGRQSLDRAIDIAAQLEWDESDNWAFTTGDDYQDPSDATTVWLPALSIPVRTKSVFTLPESHKSSLLEDLRRVTTLIAVGWRARERHFLHLLQDHMPSKPARLVAVSGDHNGARETIDNLWETGRFGSYAMCGHGFSGFTETPTGPYEPTPEHFPQPRLALDHVLSAGPGAGVWINREPGPGLSPIEDDTPYLDPGYVEL